jgi:hypothetical protein
MLKAWDENAATWKLRGAGLSWYGNGATGVNHDYSATYDAQFSAGWNPGWMTFNVTKRLQWYAAGSANYGWKLVPVSGYASSRLFRASEYPTTTVRPGLTITYVTQ